VDYTEFTAAQKRKVRAHYAALVKQVDVEIGDIVTALRETGRMENTAIIFSSDHGDHLGDHDLIGKGDFYESSVRVPLLIRLPWAQDSTTHRGLVSIQDITATLLQLGGCEVPHHMDSLPLPELGLGGARPRKAVFGFLAGGSMAFDGEWKLIKYASGEIHLFNLREDPTEQRNRVHDPACCEIYLRLDAELARELSRSTLASHRDKQVAHTQLYDDPAFGQEGWQRTYPQGSPLITSQY
jgi:arylsulfatase A-like enzyme